MKFFNFGNSRANLYKNRDEQTFANIPSHVLEAVAKSPAEFDTHFQNASAEAAQAEAQAEAQRENQARQERKIINFFTGHPDAFAQHDATVNSGDRALFYHHLSNGDITPAHKSAFLQNLKSPFDQNPQRAFANLTTKHDSRLLAHFSGAGFENYQSNSVANLQNFLANFPTPYELAASEVAFLDHIRQYNPPEKYAEYQQSMAAFKQKVYGKRLEYHDALESLQTKADHEAQLYRARMAVLDAKPAPAPNYPAQSADFNAAQSPQFQSANAAPGQSAMYQTDPRDWAYVAPEARPDWANSEK